MKRRDMGGGKRTARLNGRLFVGESEGAEVDISLVCARMEALAEIILLDRVQEEVHFSLKER